MNQQLSQFRHTLPQQPEIKQQPPQYQPLSPQNQPQPLQIKQYHQQSQVIQQSPQNQPQPLKYQTEPPQYQTEPPQYQPLSPQNQPQPLQIKQYQQQSQEIQQSPQNQPQPLKYQTEPPHYQKEPPQYQPKNIQQQQPQILQQHPLQLQQLEKPKFSSTLNDIKNNFTEHLSKITETDTYDNMNFIDKSFNALFQTPKPNDDYNYANSDSKFKIFTSKISPYNKIGILSNKKKPYSTCKAYGCIGKGNRLPGRRSHKTQKNCPLGNDDWNNLGRELKNLQTNILKISEVSLIHRNLNKYIKNLFCKKFYYRINCQVNKLTNLKKKLTDLKMRVFNLKKKQINLKKK